MPEKENPIDPTFREAAQKAARLAIQGAKGRQEAAKILLAHCGGRLQSYIRNRSYRRANHEDAEELMTDTVMKFITEKIPDGCVAEAWLYTIARNVVIDWLRKQIAEKRGGADGVEVALDDDELGNLHDTMLGHTELPGWIVECVHKAAAVMQQEKPERAMVLFMVADGWSAEDIAIYFGVKNPNDVSAKEKGAARDRKLRARIEAHEYFVHCKD